MISFLPHVFSSEEKLGRLYPVVDTLDLLHALLSRGVKTLQLRIKSSNNAVEQTIRDAIRLGNDFRACVFINDHWQWAIKYGAYGIHLGQDDLLGADTSEIAKQGIRLGVSTRTTEELEKSIIFAPSYLAIGHIFPTPTKTMLTPPQGIPELKRACQFVNKRISTVAIGGIDLTNSDQVLTSGVDAIAVVRAITQSTDLDQTLEHFAQLIGAKRA